MEYKEKRKIINLLAFAAKILSAIFESPFAQTFWQELIDTIKDKALEFPENFPLPEEVLKGYEPVIQVAVGDFFSEIDLQNIAAFVISDSSESIASKSVFHSELTKMYSQDQVYTIEKALGQYIARIKEWVLEKPDTLMQCMNHIGIKNKEFNKRLERVESQVQKFGAQIAIPSVDLKNYDSFLNNPNTFYDYVEMTPSVSIEEFFLCDNYKMVTLNNDCYDLNTSFTNEIKLEHVGDALQILRKQKVLLITGMYGTGKTTLMKKMHFELRDTPGMYTYFFKARDIKSIMEGVEKNTFNPTSAIEQKLNNLFMCLCDNASTTCVFVDEIEELNIEIEDTSFLNLFISWLCKFQKQNKWIFFVIGSRKYAQVEENKTVYVAENLFENYYLEELGKEMVIIRTDVFSPKARAEWIEEYSEKLGKLTSYVSVKREYKKIEEALKTPIFLLVFIQKYFDECDAQQFVGYYHYYSNFIDKTIKGKYGPNCIQSSFIKLPSNAQYRDVLRKIAFIILQNNQKYIDSKIYIDSITEEQPLLADALVNKKFEIPLSKLKELLSATEYVTANFINCYFFSMDNNRVYFSDTNILFALASEYIYSSIEKVVVVHDGVFLENHIKTIEMTRLYPQLIDYIIYLAKSSREASAVVSYLHSFVTNVSTKSHSIDTSLNNSYAIEKILLLYILFLKTNKEPYNCEEYRHVFKEIVYYTNAYKEKEYLSGHCGHVFSIERYFMQLELHQLRLNRVNLKYYNFKGSKISGDCKFYQCKFYETNLQNVVMEGVSFSLCDISSVKEFTLCRTSRDTKGVQAKFDCCRVHQSRIEAQAVVFRNCVIDNLQLDLTGEKSVGFINCHIKKLKISIHNNPKSAKIQFSKCSLENIPEISGFNKRDVLEMIEH